MHDGNGASVLRAYFAERDIAWVRFAVIVFNVILYLFWLPHDPARHALALGVSIVALLYALVVVVLKPYRYLPVLRTSAYTVVTDSGLIALWLYATGGIASPFYALWLLSILAVVFRFGPQVVAIATGAYAVADVGMLAVSGDVAGNLPQVASRVAYIILVGTLGMLLGHRWTDAVKERVRMTREVARREEALRDADRLRIMSDAAFEGLIIHREGRVLEANSAACRLLGMERGELVGTDARFLVEPESAEALETQLAWPTDEPSEFWIRRDGERRRIVVQARDLEFQGAPVRIAALRDITEEHEARQAREVAAAQKMEIERLQELDRFKTRFINTAAHELNTPLTPIKLQLHLLRDEMPNRPKALGILERNLDRLAHLVADMLDVARLQSGRIKIRSRAVDIAPVCDEVFETFAPTAAEQGVHLDRLLPDRVIAHADPERVVQVVTNLLSNALKFTPRGGRVTMLARETADHVRIEVIDTGKGLSAQNVEKLFQPFTQVHDDPMIPGTGLGLYICKNLAQGMGGSIGVASEGVGKGARFWLDLPRKAPDEGQPVDPHGPVAAHAGDQARTLDRSTALGPPRADPSPALERPPVDKPSPALERPPVDKPSPALERPRADEPRPGPAPAPS